MPAIVDRDDVVVAVSTGGASPTLATILRGRIEALLPERIGVLARLAQTFRAQANALILQPAERRNFWRRLIEGTALRVIDQGYVYPGFDNIEARSRTLATFVRRFCYWAEGNPLQRFGLSHLVVLRRDEAAS